MSLICRAISIPENNKVIKMTAIIFPPLLSGYNRWKPKRLFCRGLIHRRDDSDEMSAVSSFTFASVPLNNGPAWRAGGIMRINRTVILLLFAHCLLLCCTCAGLYYNMIKQQLEAARPEWGEKAWRPFPQKPDSSFWQSSPTNVQSIQIFVKNISKKDFVI